MLRKITIGILMAYLLLILSESFFKLFEMETEVIARYKLWAKIVNVKTIKTTRNSRNGGGYSTSWLITVDVKRKTPTVTLMAGPPPKKGECIPIIVNELSNDNVIALLDITEWRYGTEYGSCD